MSTSIAEVFRTRQALRDLDEATRIHRDAVLRLGTTGAEREDIAAIVEDGGRILLPDRQRAYHQLLLSAALPEDDFPAFIAATAILLTDRISEGGGTDDLYWNWEAFGDHYRLADPPVRAALMNGFRLCSDKGRVTLGDEPSQDDCLTRSDEDVLSIVSGAGLRALAHAIDEVVPPHEAGALWQDMAKLPLSWQAVAGFRHLYERGGSMAPPDPQSAPLIPWT